MTDLSKLPWDGCVLPRFKGRKARVRKAQAGNFAYIEADGYISIANQCPDMPGHWHYKDSTLDELELILRMCRIVELFIARHAEQRPTICEPESCVTNKGAK